MTDPARQRFFLLLGLRIGAMLMMLIGATLATGRSLLFGAASLPVGIVLLVIGTLDLLIVIPLLMRRWRSPPQTPAQTPPQIPPPPSAP